MVIKSHKQIIRSNHYFKTISFNFAKINIRVINYILYASGEGMNLLDIRFSSICCYTSNRNLEYKVPINCNSSDI